MVSIHLENCVQLWASQIYCVSLREINLGGRQIAHLFMAVRHICGRTGLSSKSL